MLSSVSSHPPPHPIAKSASAKALPGFQEVPGVQEDAEASAKALPGTQGLSGASDQMLEEGAQLTPCPAPPSCPRPPWSATSPSEVHRAHQGHSSEETRRRIIFASQFPPP